MSILGDDPILGGLRDDGIGGRPEGDAPSSLLHVATGDGRVVCLDSQSGDILWAYKGHAPEIIYDVATDAAGVSYSAGDDNTTRKISPDGGEIWSFDHSSGVQAVAVDDTGHVYAGGFSGAVYRITPDGTEAWIDSPGGNITSVAVHKVAERVLVGTSNNTIHWYDWSGDYLGNSGNFGTTISDISVAGDVVYGNGGAVIRRTEIGGTIWSHTPADSVRGFDVDSDQMLYAGLRDGTIEKITPGGVLDETITVDLEVELWGIALSPDGVIFVGDDTGIVRRMNPSGVAVWQSDVEGAVRDVSVVPGTYAAFPSAW